MTFLDATSPELAAASGLSELGPEEALRSFLKRFDPALVTYYLDGVDQLNLAEDEPAFFRYLVLTCAIAVNEMAGVDDTHNFRIRLGQALGVGELHSVGGVNKLWRYLAVWSERQRAKGRPVREVILPDPGSMTLIGYAVRMAFPAWRDRAQFTAVLRSISETIRRSPNRLVRELLRSHRDLDIPAPIREALKDFSLRLARGQTMLAGHRFWSLVTSIEESLTAETGPSRGAPLSIELRFGGFEQDIPEFDILTAPLGSRNVLVAPGLDGGSWNGVVSLSRQYPQSPVARSIERGYAFFRRSAGCWVCDAEGPAPDDFCVIVARLLSPAKSWKLNTTWREIDPEWYISGRIDAANLMSQVVAAGFVPAELDSPSLAGGVRLKRNVYLGRSEFLPELTRLPRGDLSLARLSGTRGKLAIDQSGTLKSDTAVEGIWRIGLIEGSNRLDISLALEPDAPEPPAYADFGEKRQWQLDHEMLDESPRDFPGKLNERFVAETADPNRMEGLGEAIFTKAGTGWRDGELIALISGAIPSPKMVWDVLRTFQEAGWLDLHVSKVWRSRVWSCRPPSLLILSESEAVVDGATPNVIRAKVSEAVARMGGRVRSIAGMSDYAPSTLFIHQAEVRKLADALEWPSRQLPGLPVADSMSQWVEDPRTADGRKLASSWSYRHGLFLDRPDGGASISLERWVRERGDEADLYLLKRAGEIVKKTASRVAAILEGHRLNGIPLFAASGDEIMRLGKSGYLPCAIARQTRFRSLRTPGPVLAADGSWRYAYQSDAATLVWLRRYLGEGISVPERQTPKTQSNMVEWRHRSGRRPGWNIMTSGSK
ncbi:hypothetical protein SAMN04515648_2886 [Phyllobacterium sp. CL33Tsu]|uniref:hypothetical protein n=1 Tax=Phyllobacterium sp. CL33Tsu TaxID=1798191 RepID=UPI0008E16B43|nr:hypothetical protein [Phyllobacterium sp. CL33Tsu]SFJ14957.1 hypothetical protein SAMN04515648_2886 [Phyllobacterium sp. CL33Tsu]